MKINRRAFLFTGAAGIGALLTTIPGDNKNDRTTMDLASETNPQTAPNNKTIKPKTIDEQVAEAIKNKRHTGDIRISKIPDMPTKTDAQLINAIKVLLGTSYKDHKDSPITLDREYFAPLIEQSIEGFEKATPGDYINTFKGNWILIPNAPAGAAHNDDFSDTRLLLNPNVIRTLWNYRNHPEVRMLLDGFFVKEGVHLKNFNSPEHRKRLQLRSNLEGEFMEDRSNLEKAKRYLQAHLDAEYRGFDVFADYKQLREFSPSTMQSLQRFIAPKDFQTVCRQYSPFISQDIYGRLCPHDPKFTKLISRVGFISSIANSNNMPVLSEAASLVVEKDFDRLGITRDIPGTRARVDLYNPRLQRLVNNNASYLLEPPVNQEPLGSSLSMNEN